MANIKNIAKNIIKKFKDSDKVVDGVKAAAGEVKTQAKNVTQKAVNGVGEMASKDVPDDLIEKLRKDKIEANRVHRKNKADSRDRERQVKKEVANILDDPDFIDNAIDSDLSPEKLMRERKRKIEREHALSPNEEMQMAKDELNYYASNVKYYGAQIGSKTKKYAGKIGNSLLDVKKNGDTFTGYEIGLTGKGKALAFGAMGVYGAYTLGNAAVDFNDMGEIEGGISVGTINQTYSKEFDKMINYANGSPEGMKEFGKVTMSDNYGSQLNHVNPEIVFALHELRNGGGY